jgi:hypothetical protein
MNWIKKTIFFWKKPKTSEREPLVQVFQNYLKARSELQVSDIKLNGNINFKVNYKGNIVPFWLVAKPDITMEAANSKVQEALTTIALGLAIGLNLVEISQALKESS